MVEWLALLLREVLGSNLSLQASCLKVVHDFTQPLQANVGIVL
jgi:hypothetical protein